MDRIATSNGHWVHCIATDDGSCTIGMFDADYKRSRFWTVLEYSDGTHKLIVKDQWFGTKELIYVHDRKSWIWVEAYIASSLSSLCGLA